MKETISIVGSAMSLFDIATYTNFQQEMYRMVTSFNGDLQQAFCISDELTTRWEKQIEVLVDVNRVIRATVNTQKLAELDTLRDRAITRLFNGIKYGLDSFEDDEVAAAKRLDLIRKKYNGIQKLNYDRQTSSVDGLLQDLGKREAAKDLTTLGLDALISLIEDTNNDFRSTYASGSDERATSKMPTFTALKSELNPIWDEVTQKIQAGYIFAANNTERQRILDLVELINQRIKQIKDAFARSQGKSGKGSTKRKADGE